MWLTYDCLIMQRISLADFIGSPADESSEDESSADESSENESSEDQSINK